MKIAIIGTRGIPANYGGFETFAENISVRLAKKGHEVTVYCRSNYVDRTMRSYKGVHLVVLPTIRHKYFDTVAHALASTLHVLFTGNKIIYFCNPVTAIFTIIPRMIGKKTIINVDGLEWRRKKWNNVAKAAFIVSERLAAILPNSVVTDCRIIQDYYLAKFRKKTEMISYGADIWEESSAGPAMANLGLKKRNFALYVSRLEPENNAHILITAYEKVKGDMPLVIVGDAPYNKKYVDGLRSTKDPRIKFAGFVYGDGYRELLTNAYLYVHGNEVGGTNPALLQAMAAGNCIVANGVDFNREVIGEAGIWFEPGNVDDLKDKIGYLIDNPAQAERYRKLAVDRVRKYYNWNDVILKYEALFAELLRKKRR